MICYRKDCSHVSSSYDINFERVASCHRSDLFPSLAATDSVLSCTFVFSNVST